MKIALIGYGKMGKMVEASALASGHEVISIIGPHCQRTGISEASVVDADICIDFSHPEHALNNIMSMAALRKNIVMGTTGWYDHLDKVKTVVERSGIGFLYSPNFSLGISLFLELISKAAALVASHGEYDVGGFEIHHSEKADSPSGTAISIARKLIANMPNKKEVIYDRPNRTMKPEEIHFSSCRLGSATGTHSVIFDSLMDSITLTHSAKSRQGFADGAVKAAEWLYQKKGFYTLEDMLQQQF